MKLLSKYFFSIGFAALLLTNSAHATSDTESTEAAELSPGAKLAQSCATCHGVDGIAVLDVAPNLAGQTAIYTTIQLKAYRDGQRQHQVMGIIAKPLSNDDINLLAEYYAGLGTKQDKSEETTTENESGEKCEPKS